ncbi:MAG: SNF2-related protein [Planctomycetota bacterium]
MVQRSGRRSRSTPPRGPCSRSSLDGAGEVELSAGWEALRARLAQARRVSTRPPRGLKAELRPYQLEGVAWLERLATWGVGACLADDMGLGKTVQAIALLVARKKEGPALVVAPTSVGANWIRELGRFAPGLRALLYRDTERGEVHTELGPGDVVVVSYDLARIDLERLAPVAWGTLVFDEAQQVKNATTKTARALRQLSGGWRLALTGTPVENHLGELWSLFRLISPGVFGGWEAFKRRFAEPIERDGDATRRAALARVIRPFVLRRTKAEVLRELPGRTDVQLDVELSPRELKLYEQTRLAAALELSTKGTKGKGDARFQILAALTKLRQLACHPRLVDASWEHGSAKLDAFLEVLDELRQGEHRALVFSQFTRHLALVREALEARGVSYLYLDGQTPARERQGLVDAFQAGEGEVFLISLKAGGKGLNLTAADYVVHLDPWWNPAVEDQATDRAHRLGQQKPVTVYRLVTQGTVEAQILALHAQKRDLVAGVLDGSDRAGKLSTDELIALIRGDEPAPARPVTPRAKRATSRSRSAPRPVADGPQALLALRQRHGLTQGQLGELLGVSAPTVCTWERGSRPLPAKRAAALRELSAASEAEVRRRLTPR